MVACLFITIYYSLSLRICIIIKAKKKYGEIYYGEKQQQKLLY